MLVVFAALMPIWSIVGQDEPSSDDNVLCASAFDEDEREQEKINCVVVDRRLFVEYSCQLRDNYKMENKMSAMVIKSTLSIRTNQGFNESVYFWKRVENPEEKRTLGGRNRTHTHHHTVINDMRENEESLDTYENRTVQLKVVTDKLMSEIVLFNIKDKSLYKICVQVPDLIEEAICCEIDDISEDEASNLYMSLIVIGILVFMYVLIVFGFWKCHDEFKSVDELLTNLPTSHVETLKGLVLDKEAIIEDDDQEPSEKSTKKKTKKTKTKKRVKIDDNDDDDDDDHLENYVRYRQKSTDARVKTKVRINDDAVEIDNKAFEGSGNESSAEDSSVRSEIVREMAKFRRMSRLSAGSIQNPTDTGSKKSHASAATGSGGKGVKFSDAIGSNDVVLNMNNVENLTSKIFSESQRRASIKPFKKAYNLNVSDSD